MRCNSTSRVGLCGACLSDAIAWPGARSVRNAHPQTTSLPVSQRRRGGTVTQALHQPRTAALTLQNIVGVWECAPHYRDYATLPLALSHRTQTTNVGNQAQLPYSSAGELPWRCPYRRCARFYVAYDILPIQSSCMPSLLQLGCVLVPSNA